MSKNYTKDYNAIRLQNGVRNAVNIALADIAVTGLLMYIAQYTAGTITADEFLTLIKEVQE